MFWALLKVTLTLTAKMILSWAQIIFKPSYIT